MSLDDNKFDLEKELEGIDLSDIEQISDEELRDIGLEDSYIHESSEHEKTDDSLEQFSNKNEKNVEIPDGLVNNKFEHEAVFKSEIFDWGEALVISLTVVILIFVFLVKLITVDGSSMLPTLYDQDKLLVSDLFFTPQNGDIVILTKDSFSENPIVKRVIATEGQTVDFDYDSGNLYVDDVLMTEPYINETTAVFGNTQFPVTVPENSVFVMGDNRNHSTDSRFMELGMVDENYILGRVLFRFYPFEAFGTVD